MQKKKFLFVSWESLSGDIAWRIQKEGHEVKAYIKAKTDQDVYDGVLTKVKKWKEFVNWADVIVFDDVGFGKEADLLRKSGKLVIGGSVYTDRLEDDRNFGQIEMQKAGMQILPHWDFHSYSSAIHFLQLNPGRYVFKPSGKAQDYKDLLFIGEEENGADILELLRTNKLIWRNKIKSFQIQKYAAGVEIAVGAFFNGKEFITPVNINFEQKRLFPGNIGPLTGDMGALMFWAEPNGMFHSTLEKMKLKLAASGWNL